MTRSPDRTPLTSEVFRNVMGHFASGVTVITADDEGTPVGSTASAFSSLSLEPPMLLVCLNTSSRTARVIHETRRFAVNILGEDAPDIAVRFATKKGDKFDGLKWDRGVAGVPLLDDALAVVECEVVEETRGGTHYVFIANAKSATLQDGSPLAYFRGRFGRLHTEADSSAMKLISDRIIRKDLPADALLDVDELALALGLPRGTTYHALDGLRDQALVYRDDDGWFRVAPLDAEMVLEAIEARRTIELGVITREIDNITPTQIESLRTAATATRPESDDCRSDGEQAQAVHDFHEQLVDLAGNDSLTRVYRQFNFTAIMGRIQNDAIVERRDISAAEEHLALVDALEKHDYHAAVSAIAHHAENSTAAARLLLDASQDEAGVPVEAYPISTAP